jgi:hypothetical protein
VRGLELEWDFLQVEQFCTGDGSAFVRAAQRRRMAGGEVWLSSGTFFGRVNFLDTLLFRRAGGPTPIPAFANATTAEAMVDERGGGLSTMTSRARRVSRFTAYARTVTNPRETRRRRRLPGAREPEFQLILGEIEMLSRRDFVKGGVALVSIGTTAQSLLKGRLGVRG